MKHFVYSYRLTHCGGTAPCFDGRFLSLAICKRDMRRVMGRRFAEDRGKDKESTFWFIGIIGSQLSRKRLDNSEEKPFDGREDDILYIAKLNEVIPFEEYFSNNPKYKDRKDHIYEEKTGGDYSITDETGQTRTYSHVPKSQSEVHIDSYLQDRDWDRDHPSARKYVLISKEYAILPGGINFQKFETHDQKFAKGVGHSWFIAENDDQIIKILEQKIAESGKDHGKKNNLPSFLSSGNKMGCGKDKG